MERSLHDKATAVYIMNGTASISCSFEDSVYHYADNFVRIKDSEPKKSSYVPLAGQK